jgi:serine/threonine protein kinase
MSPEQARGGAIDGRSDLFAVGCVLYEMMAGKKAFRGESITALIFKIITEEPQPIQELDPEIPDVMVQIIAKALAKAPEARYQSGRELADALLTLTRSGSIPTVRQVETPTLAGGSLPSVTPTVQVAAPTIATAATVGGAAPTRRMDPAPPPLPRPSPPSRPATGSPPPPRAAVAAPSARKSGGGAGLIIGLGIVGLLGALLLAGAGWYFFLRKPAVDVAEVPPTPAPTAQTDLSTPAPPPTSSPVEATPAPHSALTPPPPSTTGVATATPVPAPPPTPAATTPRQVPPSRQAVAESGGQEPPGRSFLDLEPDEGVDGRAAGEDLAGKYRSGQGYGAGSTSSTTRFRPRERSPRALAPVERPAVATIRHIINAQEAYHRKRVAARSTRA